MERHGRILSAGISFVAAFFLNGIGLGAEPNSRNDAPKAAIVNGETITLAEVDDILKARTTPLTAPTARQTRSQRLEVVTALIDGGIGGHGRVSRTDGRRGASSQDRSAMAAQKTTDRMSSQATNRQPSRCSMMSKIQMEAVCVTSELLVVSRRS